MIKCQIKNKDCENASPFGGCFAAAECLETTNEVVNNEPSVIDRLHSEIAEFKTKINKIQNFINTDTYSSLSAYHKALLSYQLELFNSVVKVLNLRIEELKGL